MLTRATMEVPLTHHRSRETTVFPCTTERRRKGQNTGRNRYCIVSVVIGCVQKEKKYYNDNDFGVVDKTVCQNEVFS